MTTVNQTNRAYSLLTVKSIDEDKREISGIATTPETDRVGDIVEPLGAKFAPDIPLLWQHDHGSPVGRAKFGKATKSGIPFTASIANILEPGVLKDMCDMAWQAVKAQLVRAVSIGFRPIEYAFMDNGGVRFEKTEIYELSLVTVPANASATITSVKSIDNATLAALGQQKSVEDPASKGANPSPGASGSKKTAFRGVSYSPITVKENTMNIKEKIQAMEEKRKSLVTERSSLQEKASDEDRTKNAEEQERFDEITSELSSIDKELKDFRVLEKDLAGTATEVTPQAGQSTQGAAATRVAVSVKNTQKLEKGIEFARYAMCQIAARGDAAKAFNISKNQYPQNERIVKALDMQANGANLEMIMKADVSAGTTLQTTWAAPLVDYQTFAGDFVEFLRPQTILGKFGQGGVPALRSIPFNVRINGQTSGGQGYWVGEGAPKPLTKFDFNAIELRWNKVANIAVLTEELIRFSNPSAERLVRDALVEALRARLDIDFVDPGKAAVANVSPASITNGVAPISSTGSDADAIRRDIRNLWAPFIAASNAPTNAVYIMSATNALALSMMQNPLGQQEFPGITMNGGTFMGIPVIVSEYLDNSAGSAGGIVILVNASDIWLADDGGFTIDASREASLQMLDNPTNNSATPTPTTMISMFQTNSIAVKCERYLSWAKRRASAVSWLDTVSWGA